MKYKYKVCVYAIAKNEEEFVNRWYESMKEADEIYVLDTGSSDATILKLEECGVNVVSRVISPWRFDVARNESLNLLPDDTDICVCTDLDEVFSPGWRMELENTWQENTNRIRYIYNWKLDNNKPLISFYYEKIHSRNGYKWIYPVHEVLSCSLLNEEIKTCDKIVLNHYPDPNKSRSSYLGLLELSVMEDANNDRNLHYLGREYMYYKRYNDAIDTLIRHINLDSATWNLERAASMRFIGRCYLNLNRVEEARLWYLRAIDEASNVRDGLVELAILEYNEKNYLRTIELLTRALLIKNHEKVYINEVFSWDYTIDNLLSCCYYYLGLYDISLFFIDRALLYDIDSEMLNNNKKIISDKIKRFF